MYLYHYPDIWYDYATWHAKSGSVDSAIKVYQRALKALPGKFPSAFHLPKIIYSQSMETSTDDWIVPLPLPNKTVPSLHFSMYPFLHPNLTVFLKQILNC